MFNNLVVAGDYAKTGLFIGLAVVAIAIVVVLAVTSKKKEDKE